MDQGVSKDRAETVRRLFDALVERAPAEQAARLTAIDDVDLRQEVASLLDAYDRSDAKITSLDELRALLAHSAANADPHRLVGRRIRQYVVEAHLGGGGMGIVYKARDTKLGRMVALKFLPPHLGANAEAKERFMREARAASALDHPNIGTVHEINETKEGQLFIAMTYYAGETLKAKIARGPLPVEGALDYAKQVAEGLARAHEAGIIHRDVKPANVMVTERGRVKLVDFGLAKMQDVSLTQAGQALGTVAYMSAEQARGAAVDARTDLWSLGALLYEMLTGTRPFRGIRPEAVIYAILNEAPTSMVERRPETPRAIEAVVERCLVKDPEERYPDANALLDDLRAVPSASETAPTRWMGHVLWAVGGYAAVSLLTFGVAYGLTAWLGLPSWTVSGTVLLLTLGAPVVAATALVEAMRHASLSSPRSNRLSTFSPVVQAGALKFDATAGRWLHWPAVLQGSVLAFGGLALAVTVFMASRMLGVGPFATLLAAGTLSDEDRIVLADFATQPVDTTLADAVTDAFRVDLSQSPAVKLASQAVVRAALERMKRAPGAPLDVETAREVAIREGLKAVVGGEINAVEAGFVLSARLVAAETREELVALRETAQGENGVIPAIDRLSKALRERIGESLKNMRESPPLHQVRTASLEALMRYTAGGHVNAHGYNFERCVTLLTEAIAIDPLFAAAYSRRGACKGNMGGSLTQTFADLRKAFELRDRMTDRGRVSALNMYYLFTGEHERAIDVIEAYMDLYPENGAFLNNLSLHYAALGQLGRAEEIIRRHFEWEATLGSEMTPSTLSWGNLTRYQIAQDKLEEAEKTLRQWEGSRITGWAALRRRTQLAAARGEYKTAETHVQAWRERESGSLYHRFHTSTLLGRLAGIRGALTEAETHFRDAMEASTERGDMYGYYLNAQSIALMHLWLRGDSAQARATLDAVRAERPLRSVGRLDRAYHEFAISYAQAGRPNPARRFFETARDSIPRELDRRYEEHIHIARGWTAVAEGRLEEAAAAFKRWNPRLPWGQADRHFALGLIYDRMAEPDSALVHYERYLAQPHVSDQPWSHTNWTHSEWWQAPVHERLGRLYEARGEVEQATRHYTRFVELWKEADAALQPRMESAQKALLKIELLAETG